MSDADFTYCDKFLKDLDENEIRVSNNANIATIKTTIQMSGWSKPLELVDTVSGFLGRAITFYKDDRTYGNAHFLREWIDKAKVANCIDPIGLNSRLKKLNDENEELRNRVSLAEQKYLDCWDEKQKIEGEKADLQTQLDAQRAEDIRNSMNREAEQSKVEPNDKEEKE